MNKTKGKVISSVNELNSKMQQKGTKVFDDSVRDEFKNRFTSIAKTVYETDNSIEKKIDALESKLNNIKVDFKEISQNNIQTEQPMFNNDFYPTPINEDEFIQFQNINEFEYTESDIPLEYSDNYDDLSYEDMQEIFGYGDGMPMIEQEPPIMDNYPMMEEQTPPMEQQTPIMQQTPITDNFIHQEQTPKIPIVEEKLLIDVDVVNNLLEFSKENRGSLSKEQISNINALYTLLKFDEALDNGINDIYQIKKDLIDEVTPKIPDFQNDLNQAFNVPNSNNSNFENEVSNAKESLNDSLKSIKETKKETSSLLSNIANALRNGGDLVDQLEILKNIKVKDNLEAVCGNLQRNIVNLDKAINCMNDISVKFKTGQQNFKNLTNTIKGENVSRLKVEPSEKFVKPLVAIQDTMIKLEEKHSQKIEKVTENTLEKLSIRQKLDKNKQVINGDVGEPNKDTQSKIQESTFNDKCNQLATDITLFLQNTSYSAGAIEEIKDNIKFGNTESIKDCLLEATNDSNNYLIKNIDKFELENYPKELLISSKDQLILLQKDDNSVNFKIFDTNLNVLSNNTIDSNDNIFKDFSNFTKHDLKDLIKAKKCKIGDIDKFKDAVAKKTQERQQPKQPKQKKVRENVML